MGTKCAVAFAANTIRWRLLRAVLLDLKKANDLVPRATIQHLIDHRLTIALVRQIRSVLWAMVLRTKTKVSQNMVVNKAGVPQWHPTSPSLFAIFMDSFLAVSSERPWRDITSLSVEDILELVKTYDDLQNLRNSAHQ